MKVSCVILNYNGKAFLDTCVPSVLGLSHKNKEVIFLDNASTDDSVAHVKKQFPDLRIVVNEKNSGYTGGANKAIEIASGDALMILNPDIVYESDYLDHLVEQLEADKKIGSIIGKLRVYDFEHNKKTELIDSAGLVMHRNRRCVDRGQGQKDEGQFDQSEEVFGITGASPLYRISALEDVSIFGECFDEDFFMYKEDVDISWRLRLFGWKALYEPKALAYHGRGTGAVERQGALQVAQKRGSLSIFQRELSYRNERLMRVKNEMWGGVGRDFLKIVWKEVMMFAWMLIFEHRVFKGLWGFFMKLPRALKKRREIMKRKKTDWKELKRWFV